jgi:hypothetical protein
VEEHEFAVRRMHAQVTQLQDRMQTVRAQYAAWERGGTNVVEQARVRDDDRQQQVDRAVQLEFVKAQSNSDPSSASAAGGTPSTSGGFGTPSTPGFGTPSAFGAAPAPGGFGASGMFGSTPAPSLFGSTPTSGMFGAAPSPGLFGGGAPTFGATPGGFATASTTEGFSGIYVPQTPSKKKSGLRNSRSNKR